MMYLPFAEVRGHERQAKPVEPLKVVRRNDTVGEHPAHLVPPQTHGATGSAQLFRMRERDALNDPRDVVGAEDVVGRLLRGAQPHGHGLEHLDRGLYDRLRVGALRRARQARGVDAEEDRTLRRRRAQQAEVPQEPRRYDAAVRGEWVEGCPCAKAFDGAPLKVVFAALARIPPADPQPLANELEHSARAALGVRPHGIHVVQQDAHLVRAAPWLQGAKSMRLEARLQEAAELVDLRAG
mmetsp:Transcript_26027/g.76288  ORF Transcript_26027/g.76288 Transcript_26027/m.76288 type:complete len:239 (-) Transcript_26027:459-1175(-)